MNHYFAPAGLTQCDAGWMAFYSPDYMREAVTAMPLAGWLRQEAYLIEDELSPVRQPQQDRIVAAVVTSYGDVVPADDRAFVDAEELGSFLAILRPGQLADPVSLLHYRLDAAVREGNPTEIATLSALLQTRQVGR